MGKSKFWAILLSLSASICLTIVGILAVTLGTIKMKGTVSYIPVAVHGSLSFESISGATITNGTAGTNKCKDIPYETSGDEGPKAEREAALKSWQDIALNITGDAAYLTFKIVNESHVQINGVENENILVYAPTEEDLENEDFDIVPFATTYVGPASEKTFTIKIVPKGSNTSANINLLFNADRSTISSLDGINIPVDFFAKLTKEIPLINADGIITANYPSENTELYTHCKYLVSGAEASVKGYNNPINVEVVPFVSYENKVYTTTSLAENGFAGDIGSRYLESITLPNSIKTIKSYAFYMACFTTIKLPNSLTSIETSAFQHCYELTSFEFPNSLTTIGDDAFYGSTSIKHINIPNNISNIGNRAFYFCKALNYAIIENPTCPTIGTSVFRSAAEGFAIFVPEGLYDTYKANSGWSAYPILEMGSNYQSLYGYEDLWEINGRTFTKENYGHAYVGYVSWTNSGGWTGTGPLLVSETEENVYFNDWEGHYSDTVGGSFEYNGKTYYYSSNSYFMQGIIENAIDNSLPRIDMTSLNSDEIRLAAIMLLNYIKASVTSGAGSGSNSETSASQYPYLLFKCVEDFEYGGVEYRNVASIEGVIEDSALGIFIPENLIIPSKIEHNGKVYSVIYIEGITSDSIKSIKIPKSVTIIGSYFFGDDSLFLNKCPNLEQLIVEEGNPVYHSSGNCIIETESKTLIAGCKTSIIPDDGSVTKIGSCAFYECTNLTTIKIPNTIIRINSGAFYESGLVEIEIPETVEYIEDGAFYNCTSLSTVISWPLTCVGALPSSEDYIPVFGNNAHDFGILIPSGTYANYSQTEDNGYAITNGWADYPLIEMNPVYQNACKDDILWTLNSRNYKKAYSDHSFVAYGQMDLNGARWTGPLMISKTQNGAKYDSYYNDQWNSSTANPSTFEYNGETYYLSPAGGWWQGAFTNTLYNNMPRIYSQSLDTCLTPLQAAKKILRVVEILNCTVASSNEMSYLNFTYDDTKRQATLTSADPTTTPTNVDLPHLVNNGGKYYLINRIGTKNYEDPIAFDGCSNLKSLRISKYINSFAYAGGTIIKNCANLESLSVEEGNRVYYSQQNCIMTISSNDRYLVVGCKTSIIPANTIGIQVYAFCGQTGLTSITIPERVEVIASSAFEGCTNLKDMYLKPSTPPRLNGSYLSTSVTIWTKNTSAYSSSSYWSAYTIKYDPS